VDCEWGRLMARLLEVGHGKDRAHHNVGEAQ
jgi:hypothetical protein